MAKLTKRKAGKRWERRFLPRSTTNPNLVYVVGGLGAIALGGGFWGQFGNYFHKVPEDFEPWKYAAWVLAGGAVIVGIAIWMGTSAAAALRVGSGGIAEERGADRRLAWWQIHAIFWDNGLVARGKNDEDNEIKIRVSLAAFPDAAAWFLSEAQTRIPDKIDLDDEVRAASARKDKTAGESVEPVPLQLVGRRCAKSDKVIAYEPDARVCPSCERVYHKSSVPKKCACGASLMELREKESA